MDNAYQEALFWLLTAVTIGGALAVVTLRSVFRSALALAVSFIGVAGIFAMVYAPFLAVVQVLIYVGGVAVLIIFAVMITRDIATGNSSTSLQPAAFFVAVALLAGLVYAIARAEWDRLPAELPAPLEEVFVNTPAQLGGLLLGNYVLAFEIAGVLLLAVVIGALALVRER